MAAGLRRPVEGVPLLGGLAVEIRTKKPEILQDDACQMKRSMSRTDDAEMKRRVAAQMKRRVSADEAEKKRCVSAQMKRRVSAQMKR